MAIRKSTKEKILPYRQQVTRIKQYLSNRGVEVRTGEIEDHMSQDLHYDENKTNVLAAFGKKKKVRKRIDEYQKSRVYEWLPKNVVDDIANAKCGTKRKSTKCSLMDTIPIAFDARAETEECGVEHSSMEKWLSKAR